MNTKAIETSAPKFEDRVRFNWGFHDGQYGAQQKRRPMWTSPHFDKVYEAGYSAGVEQFKAEGTRSETSEPAWRLHTAEKKQLAAARKALRDARPVATVRI